MENMNIQPKFNIGCMGSVGDGKSTIIKMFTDKETQQDSREKKRNITINQGFGNMKIWEDTITGEYTSTDSTPDEMVNNKLINHISFVDCPGHQQLIKTMLGALELMHGAIIVVAVDQSLTMKPQLAQHLAAAKLGSINKIIICMNKIDLVTKDELMKRKEELDKMLKLYDIKPYKIIPTCFNKKIGYNHIISSIMELFNPNELYNTNKPPIFNISRTFDINKPGTDWTDVTGGVIGGTLKSGKFKIGDMLEIHPGFITINKTAKTHKDKFICMPISITVNSIMTDTTQLTEATAGGLIGIGTDLDPFYCKKNALVGHIAGFPGQVPNIYSEIVLKTTIIDTFGFKWEPKIKDIVTLKIGTLTCEARLVEIENKLNFKFELNNPVCIDTNENIIVCREIDKILRVVAQGTL